MKSFSAEPKTISRGKTLKIRYEIVSSEYVPENVSDGIWLGATLTYTGGGSFSSKPEDKSISLSKGVGVYERDFTVPTNAPLGNHTLRSNVWHGVRGDGTNAVVIATGGFFELVVVA